jgi:type IV pilus biogenesis protein CpaD/CtpE
MPLRYVDIAQFSDSATNPTSATRLQEVRDWLTAEGVTGMSIYRMTTITDATNVADVGKVTVEFVQNNQRRTVNRRPTNRPPWESWEKVRSDQLPTVFF